MAIIKSKIWPAPPPFQTISNPENEEHKRSQIGISDKKVTPTAPTDYAEQLKLRKSAKNRDYLEFKNISSKQQQIASVQCFWENEVTR